MGHITVEQLFIDLAIILYLNFSLIISDILEIKKKNTFEFGWGKIDWEIIGFNPLWYVQTGPGEWLCTYTSLGSTNCI